MSRQRGFTLIELLVVVAIIALLVGILLPSLSSARRAARQSKCLVQVRSLSTAHVMFMNEHRERFIDAGLGHGGLGEPERSWPVQLEAYTDGPVALRSPADDSRFWATSQDGQDAGLTLAQYLELRRSNPAAAASASVARWTSYGLNNYLTPSKAPAPELTGGRLYDTLPRIARPHATVHFLMMTLGARGGAWAQFAKSDHVHAEGWGQAGEAAAPGLASREMALNVHGGAFGSAQGVANYGYLDGHARAASFAEVYTDDASNSFNPEVAK